MPDQRRFPAAMSAPAQNRSAERRPTVRDAACNRRAGQRKEQPAEIVKLALRAPSRHAPVDIAAAAFDQPFGTVQALPLVGGVEGPEVGGDQRLPKTRPISRRQSRLGRRIVRWRRPEPALVYPANGNRVTLAADANAHLAVEAAVPDEAVDLRLALHSKAQR